MDKRGTVKWIKGYSKMDKEGTVKWIKAYNKWINGYSKWINGYSKCSKFPTLFTFCSKIKCWFSELEFTK